MEMEPRTTSNGPISGSASSPDLSKTDHSPIISKVTPADLPALVEAELLSFAGTTATDALARQLHPFRADLVRARIPAQRWPDFAPTVRARKKTLNDKRVVMVKAEVALSSGRESRRSVAVGMVWLRLPELDPSPHISPRNPMRMAANLTKTHLYPALDKLESKLWSESNTEADGTDHTFLEVFKAEVIRARKEVEREVLNGAPYISLELIYAHPEYRGAGVGAALLSYCTALSESASASSGGLPLLLESTLVATPLYIRFGFHEVYRSRVEYRGQTYSWPVMLREPTNKGA